MRTFAQKWNRPQERLPSSLAPSAMAISRPVHRDHLDPLSLQRTIGNQALQEMLESRTGAPTGRLTATGPPFFTHPFSRSALHAPRAEAIQTKQAIPEAKDPYEQEAGRIAEQVTAIPAHTAAGGARADIQRFSGQSDGQADAAPATVAQALATPGRPLEPALRRDMEQHFGHDFSRVRVHSDAAAGQSAQDVNAHAYTVGHHIVFGRGFFASGTHEGRRLIAHELTHVVQQSGLDGTRGIPAHPSRAPITTAIQPGLVQRDGKRPDARQAARARVVAAMETLKKKFGLSDVSEEHGATWSEAELRRVDIAFSKMSKEEQKALHGVSLVRTDKLSMEHKGKTIELDALTTGGVRVQFTAGAFRSNLTPLHEAGHVIQHKAVSEAEEKFRRSRAGTGLEAAREKFEVARRKIPGWVSGTDDQKMSVQMFSESFKQLTDAAGDLLNSDDDNQAARRNLLRAAQTQSDADRMAVEPLQNNFAARAYLEAHDRQKEWVRAVEHYIDEKAKAVGPRKNLKAFVDLVRRHNLARRGFAPFTAYVASFWPDKPEEFFVQCYATWRDNPGYMKKYARPLFDWFEKGGHLEPKSLLEEARETAPVLTELASEAAATFLPAIEGGIELIP